MNLRHVLLGALFSCSTANAKPVDWSSVDFKEAIKGKNVIVRFVSEWCGEKCKETEDDFNRLADDYAGSNFLVVAQVDCVKAEDHWLCAELDIIAYPTIKWFLGGDTTERAWFGYEWEDDMDYDTLKPFAERLDEKCQIWRPELTCSHKEQDYLYKMKRKPSEDQTKEIDRLHKLVNDESATMKPELRTWARQRLHILNALQNGEEHTTEWVEAI